MKQPISIIGVPMWYGQSKYGVNLGPEAMRSAGIIELLQKYSGDVEDCGNISITKASMTKSHDSIKNLQPVVAACERLAAVVSEAVSRNRYPLILGGDHSIAIGTLAGLAQHYANLGVIWFDAHADINIPETSPSGNIHGMPLAVSLGLGHPDLTQIGGIVGKIKPRHLVYIGVRDMDPGEIDLVTQYGIKLYSASEVRKRGIDTVIREALNYLRNQCDGIHLSFDFDGIDPKELPGVGTPVAKGISYEQSLLALQLLAQSQCITSAEWVELNPLLDRAGKTVQAAAALLTTFLQLNDSGAVFQPKDWEHFGPANRVLNP